MGGATPKPLVRLGAEALLARTLRAYVESDLDEVVVVLGYARDQVETAAAGVRVLENPLWQRGLGASIATAIRGLSADSERVLIGLGDMPWVSPEVIAGILAAEGSIVAPVFDGQRGHPVRFDRRYFGELAALDGDRGAGGLLERYAGEVKLLEVEEPVVLRDLDVPGDVPRYLPGVVVRGGGDLATGIVHTLYSAGFPVLILELAQPRMLRAAVSFSQAVYSGRWTVEGVTARRFWRAPCDWRSFVPVVVDPEATHLHSSRPTVMVDARVLMEPGDLHRGQADFVVAVGPGIVAGEHCHAVVETNRGPRLGTVILEGPAEPDTGVPGVVGGESFRRVVRSPARGGFRRGLELGATVRAGDVLGWVDEHPVVSQLDGMLRGVVHSGIKVEKGEKGADVDPRQEGDLFAISDKARRVGQGVLEAVLGFWVSKQKNAPILFKIGNLDQGDIEQT